ncbi:MAG: hypothetical protein JSW71_00200 [Gemmatimonadota bacterium]|nr:MAG: hypothetical protein JSW71_00200 [Gemmatimonadota bacterium]
MLRRAEFWLLLAVAAAMFGAATIGRRVAPSVGLLDERRSASLSGPLGAKALAELLERLGLEVELRRRPLFDWGSDSVEFRGPDYLALLDVDIPLTDAEQRALRNAVARGHSLLLAGANGVERCFGYQTRHLGRFESDSSTALAVPRAIDSLPDVAVILERVTTDSLREALSSLGCDILFPMKTDTLLATLSGQTVAARLWFSHGGTVTLIADSWLVTNRALRETDVGLLIVPWILELEPNRMEIDEYHHGFQDRTSIFTAAWGWLYRSPLGWGILQLSGVALLTLAVAAVRFGPVRAVVKRERRSALEHVDALAAGLQRAQSGSTAVTLIAGGLRRRLSRIGTMQRGHETLADWLVRLAFPVRTAEARRKVKRLAWLVREPGGDQHVLEAATAVEDVWEALGQHYKPDGSSKP